MTFTPRTWVIGEVVSAALMNQEIRDQFNSFFGAWTTYTPTWIAEGGAAPTLGNGTLTGRYAKIGRTVDWVIQLTWGSTTVAGGGGASENWAFTLPASPAAGFTYRTVKADALDTSASLHYGAAGVYSTANGGSIRSLVDQQAASTAIWDSAAPFTWAAGDILYLYGRYEAAA